MNTLIFTVLLWNSDPAVEGAEVYGIETAADFGTLGEALAVYNKPFEHFTTYNNGRSIHSIEIVGGDFNAIRKNPLHVPTPDNDNEWTREQAMQAGMAMGCEAYNDAMGYY